MLESILITTGPIAAGLLAVTILRLRGMLSSKTDLVAEYPFPDEEDEVGVSGDEAGQVQTLWRRSYSK